jgi:competence protein ComEC
MLIDAGNQEDANSIKTYLTVQKVKQIDILVATHPHEDHIGGMADIVRSFKIGQVYMPKVSTNTQTFKDLLLAIKIKGLKVRTAFQGVALDLDPSITTVMIAPQRDKYENLNDYSAVIKLTYDKTSFLLTGDAAAASEFEMLLSSAVNPRADVLKVGHHGSNTSTTAQFLKAVSPKYAVISVGTGNDYGHPGQWLLKRLNNARVQVFRTDQCGTVVATSDGQSININKKASPIKPNAPPLSNPSGQSVRDYSNGQTNNGDITVFITNSGRKYHVDGCKGLSNSQIPITIKEAKKRGYEPCRMCNPPN